MNAAKTGLGACLVGLIFFFPFYVVNQGWPESVEMLLGRLIASALAGLIFFGLGVAVASPGGRRILLGVSVVIAVAGLLSFGFGVNGWVAVAVASVLTFVLFRACEESALVRKAACAGVVVAVLFPFAVLMLPPIPPVLRLALALLLTGALGAWAGWRAWPVMETRMKTAGWSARHVNRASGAHWQRASAEARGEVSAEHLSGRHADYQ